MGDDDPGFWSAVGVAVGGWDDRGRRYCWISPSHAPPTAAEAFVTRVYACVVRLGAAATAGGSLSEADRGDPNPPQRGFQIAARQLIRSPHDDRLPSQLAAARRDGDGAPVASGDSEDVLVGLSVSLWSDLCRAAGVSAADTEVRDNDAG